MWEKILLVSGLVLACSFGANAQDASGDLAIIVGKSSGLDNVTTAELVKIFKAEKAKGPDGVKFALTMRESGSPERASALSRIFSMSEAEYGKYFLQATFTGAVTAAPKQLASAAAVKQFVAGTAGGIGYVKGSEADDLVRVLKVDGKAPGEAGYPLKIK